MQTKTVTLYSYDELSAPAQSVAAGEWIADMLQSVPYESMTEACKKACDKAEEMQTPWFVGSYVWDYCKHQIIDEMRQAGDIFRSNGKVSVET